MKNKLKKLVFISVIVLLPLGLSPLDRKKTGVLELLLSTNRFQEAEKFCRKLKNQTDRAESFKFLADYFFRIKDFDRAAKYYNACNCGEGNSIIGDYFLRNRDYKNAVRFYARMDTPSEKRAIAYEAAADGILKENSPGAPEQAKIYYKNAINDYESIMKTIGFEWKNEFYPYLKRCLMKINKLPKKDDEETADIRIKKILEKTGDYCEKLKTSAFHFFCNEEIMEKVDLSKEVSSMGSIGSLALKKPVVKKKYLYEYQLLKEGDKINETRKLLKRDNVKTQEENARLETWGYYYEKLIFGPIALLGKYWQPSHYYKIEKEELLDGEKVIVIESIPTEFSKENPLFGMIWIRERDFSVMKIQWNPKSMGNFPEIIATAEKYGAVPDMICTAEFNIEKNGIRFPNRYYMEEAYIDEKGKRFVRVEQNVILKAHMFFTVGTDVVEAEYQVD
jgi:hypothetical protein